jgi:hypothetical protein
MKRAFGCIFRAPHFDEIQQARDHQLLTELIGWHLTGFRSPQRPEQTIPMRQEIFAEGITIVFVAEAAFFHVQVSRSQIGQLRTGPKLNAAHLKLLPCSFDIFLPTGVELI